MGASFVNSFPQAPLNIQSTFRNVGKGLWLVQGRLPVWGSGGDCGCSILGEWLKGQCTAVFEQRRRRKTPPTFHRLESLVGVLQALPLWSLMAEQLLWLCQVFEPYVLPLKFQIICLIYRSTNSFLNAWTEEKLQMALIIQIRKLHSEIQISVFWLNVGEVGWRHKKVFTIKSFWGDFENIFIFSS